ncbi:unnamed protein product [Mytilus coruscus]|uniref:Uncharacterized protein n=1 Tax=Mytilus coruscus TaxID=42192 RepID=A0A6J8ER28_MYTCO|nr:unnamed protein product [Mytilus coruscus]
MSAENTLSVDIYKYLCHKIGYEDEVKVRRLTYIIDDLGIPSTKVTQITSGSKDEGLQLKGSDLDLMFIDPSFKVYESDRDVVPKSNRTKISRSIFFVMLSYANQDVPQILQIQPNSNNKHKYLKYKRDRSHLLIGTNSDANTALRRAKQISPSCEKHYRCKKKPLENIKPVYTITIKLRQEIIKHFTTNRFNPFSEPLFFICLGIAHQMLGEIDSARQCFLQASQKDQHHITSASKRLSNLDLPTMAFTV